MSRYTKTPITQLSSNEQAAINSINKNLEDIESAIQDTVSRSGNTPTHMTSDLDLNGKRIINVPAPKTDTDLVRKVDVVGDIETVKQLVNTTTNAAAQTLEAAQAVQEIMEDAHLGLVADDLALGDDSKIKKTADNIDDVTVVADNITDISAVAANKDNIENVADNKTNIDAVAGNAININAVATNISNVNSVAGNSTNINAVAGNATNINAVVGNATNINAVAGNESDIDTVAGIASDVSTVAGNAADISNVATNMSDVNTCATNIAAIQAAPSAASSAAASAEQAAISAAGTHFKLFHHDWFDYQLNDIAWLRADTFSWQDGTVYSNAYNHLVADYQGGTSQTETVGSYTITYVLAADGHKITTDETNVANIYNESGVAWYYILDTANQRFKLPRENPAREELIQVVRAKGNGIALGLTNGTSTPTFGLVTSDNLQYNPQGSVNAYGTNVGTSCSTNAMANVLSIGITTDSTNSGIVSDMTESSSVYKGKQYLYFYVGQFSQSATEQTAGLNSELFNGKADIEALNNKIQPVSTLPVTPTSGVLYVIPE